MPEPLWFQAKCLWRTTTEDGVWTPVSASTKEMVNEAQRECSTGLFLSYYWPNVTVNMYGFILRQLSLRMLNLGMIGAYKFIFKKHVEMLSS